MSTSTNLQLDPVFKFSFSAIALIAFCGCGQTARDVANNAPQPTGAAFQEVVVPLQDANDELVVVAAAIDKRFGVQLMLHTGVSNVSLTKACLDKFSDLKFEEKGNIESWGGSSELRWSPNHEFSMGLFQKKGISLFECVESGEGTDGKFGLDLFAGQIVCVDRDHRELRLLDKLPENVDDYAKITLHARDGLLYLNGRIGVESDKIDIEWMLHTGFNGSLLISDEVMRDHRLPDRLEKLQENELTDSLGNIIKVQNFVLPEFEIGGCAIEGIKVGRFEGRVNAETRNILGMGILKGFNWMIDSASSSLYVQRRVGRSTEG